MSSVPNSPFLLAKANHWRERLARFNDRFSVLAPILSVALFLLAITAALWYLHSEELARERDSLKRNVEYAQQRVRLRLLERQEVLMRLARTISNDDSDASLFQPRAESVLAQSPDLASLTWIDDGRAIVAAAAAPLLPNSLQRRPGEQLSPGDTESGFALTRDLMQPVYVQPAANALGRDAMLELYLPLSDSNGFAGVLLAEFSLDGLIRHAIPNEVSARYAIALLDANQQVLAGQSIPERNSAGQLLPWTNGLEEYQVPVSPVGNGLLLRAQAWRVSPGLLGNMLFWLVAALSLLAAWTLIANWRHLRRRQQAQALLQAEITFRQAMENSMATGMRALDLQGRIIYVNPAFCQMTGWSESELVGTTAPFPYWPDDDRADLNLYLQDELGGNATHMGHQMRVKRKDGTLFDARLYVTPLVDTTGKQSGWMAAMTDITEPNRIRRQLSAAQERFTTVLQALDASVSVAPLGSTELLFANRLYRQWFGDDTRGHLTLVERGATLGTQYSDDSLDTVDGFAGLPTDSLADSVGDQAELYVPNLDKWLEIRSRYLNWVDGRIAQMVIATDITARKHAEDLAASQAERAQTASRLITMGEMASSVAHELNQPLTAISNYCSGMLSRIESGQISTEDLQTALQKTAKQAQRAGQIIQRIRAFVKRSEPNRSWCNVHELVEEALELVEIEARRRRVQLTRYVQPHLPPIHVDPILIEQVLINLMKNAAESVDAAARPLGKRKVDLNVTRASIEGQDCVRFQITDTGSGLPPEVLERLFEAFFSTKQEGMGIGLNLCRSIVESHHGRIQAQNLYNDSLPEGCRFTFWIPI
ncbi:PAS domain-containing sensor histidine kinase [Comamonas serinivorans]|uniref:histidine kinase n=1 Tax=Comamonas serinivorans TaxID=1082851 RepID=A0A1Y0EKS3_9BURK|nr:PAS domain-containing sensor histidine kinase [Comamonas serinivorans]ARU04028.1 PAS domain-containing sensor histidine kinase [Comamonas serinivorans]